MKGNFYVIVYAAALGTACALLLTFASSFTAPYREDNAKAEENRNVLMSLNVPFDSKASSKELVEIFNKNVSEKMIGDLTTYVYSFEGTDEVQALAVRFEGPGLWGPVKGFLALESDMKTIRGITFYQQEETPGMGGEIASDWFRQQFVGKSIIDKKGKSGIVIRSPGAVLALNEVHAITGATMTCDKVQDMLNTVIEKIAKKKD